MTIEKYILPWSLWFFALLVVLVIYVLLLLTKKVVDEVNILESKRRPILELLGIILRIYEPLAILSLLVGFVFINPLLHGLLSALIFVLAFNPIKNYVNGRLFLLMHHLEVGQRLRVNETEGIIRKVGMMGISLQTQDGIRFINYGILLSDGYLLLKGEKIGQLYQLLISQNEDKKSLTVSNINKQLFSCPYIDWSMRPQVTKNKESQHSYFVQVLVREDTHLKSLMDVIKEWGYLCQVLD